MSSNQTCTGKRKLISVETDEGSKMCVHFLIFSFVVRFYDDILNNEN